MSDYKYPYIPREYYAAVMYACKMIRQYGNFNRSVRIAANYYDVDEETLAEHIRKRQAAGQKVKTTGRKYKYFVVAEYTERNEGSEKRITNLTVEKGLSKESVERKFLSSDERFDRRNDTGGYYSCIRYHVAISEHETKEEAVRSLRK